MKKMGHCIIATLFLVLTACSSLPDFYGNNTGNHQYMDDRVVTAKVRAALIEDPQIKNNNVSVNTYQGQVQLSGYVDSKAERKHAARVAAEVPGVLKVKNNLVIK